MTSIEEVLKNRLLFTIKRRSIWEFLDGEKYIILVVIQYITQRI